MCHCCTHIGKLTRTGNDRIAILQKRLRYLQACNLKNNNKTSADGIKETKEELAALQAEETSRDRLRAIPLLSSKITGYRFFCSSCWEHDYLVDHNKRKKERNSGKKWVSCFED
jgi:hypothetical protein